MRDPQPCGSVNVIPIELWDEEAAHELLWDSLREGLDEWANPHGWVIDDASVKRHEPVWLRAGREGDDDGLIESDREHAEFVRIQIEAVAKPQ